MGPGLEPVRAGTWPEPEPGSGQSQGQTLKQVSGMGLCRGMGQCKGTEGAGVRAETRLCSEPGSGQGRDCAQNLEQGRDWARA